MTGFPIHVKQAVMKRASGHCERCGHLSFAYEYHHRRPRGMGGSKAADTNTAANCLLLCPSCHADIESDRVEALRWGWLVRQGVCPEMAPVLRRGNWVFLTQEGGCDAGS